MSSGSAGKGMGSGRVAGHEGTGTTDPHVTKEDEIGSDIQGRNSLQGSDQGRVRNERQTMPEESSETEGVVESFEKMDPRNRR